METVNLDLASYIARRKGQVEQRARDGSAYGFVGERKVRRALVSARPVTIAIEATTRAWRGKAKTEALAQAVRATDVDYPQALAAAQRGAGILGIKPPPIYVTEDSAFGARALGTDEDPLVLVGRRWVDSLSDDELTALVGHELGHIQNNQLLYITALTYLQKDALFVVRWVVRPAIMALQAWSRRAEITCDRAALITCASLEVAISTLLKVEGGETEDVDVAAYLQSLPKQSGVGRYTQVFRGKPGIPLRVRALARFAESRFFRRMCGNDDPSAPSTDAIDADVSEMMSVF